MNDALLLNLGSLLGTLFVLLVLFLIADTALRAAVRAIRSVQALSRLEGIAALRGGVRTLPLATLLMTSLGVTGVAAWMMISDMVIPYVIWDVVHRLSPNARVHVALIFGEGVLILVALAVVRRLTRGIVQAAAKAADDWEELQTNDLALEAFFNSSTWAWPPSRCIRSRPSPSSADGE
jgi:hypothetical protein